MMKDAAEPPPAPPVSSVLEAAVYADDLDAAEEFSGHKLGLTKLARAGNRHVFYRVGSVILLIFNAAETRRPPGNRLLPVPPHGCSGQGHVCLAAEGHDFEAWRKRLISMGIEIEAELSWPNGARSLYFRDPAGNSIEIAEPHLWA